MTVCADPLTACLHLGGWPDGSIILRSAREWPMAARYLAGEDVPCPIPARRFPKPIVTAVARDALVNRRTARNAIVKRIESEGGVGALFLSTVLGWTRDQVIRGMVLPADSARRLMANYVHFGDLLARANRRG